MDDASSKLRAFSTNILESKDKAQAILSSYGLIIWDWEKQKLLHDNKYMYGLCDLCDPDVKFVFVSVDIFPKFFYHVNRFGYISPFMFCSKFDKNSYFVLDVKSTAFKDLQRWGNLLLKNQEAFEENGFILPLKEHWDSFESSKDSSSPIISLDIYSFVRIEKVKNSIASMDEFSYFYRLFDNDKHYFILKNDCELMRNLKDDSNPTDTKTKILNEGFIEPTITLRDEIRQLVENNNSDGDPLINIKDKQFVLVLEDYIYSLYESWRRTLVDNFMINLAFKKIKHYYILHEPSEALIKAKAKVYPAEEALALVSLEIAKESFNSRFVDLEYSLRCICMYISRHYICESFALRHNIPGGGGRQSPFAYSCILSQFQTSGSGKSRTSQLLSLVMDTLYVPSKTQSGFPRECQVFEEFKQNLDVWVRKERFDYIPISVLLVLILNFFNRLLYLCLKKREYSFEFMNPDDLLDAKDRMFIMDNFQEFIDDVTKESPQNVDTGSGQMFKSFGQSWTVNYVKPFGNKLYRIPFCSEILNSHPLAKDFSFEELKQLLVKSRETRIEEMVKKLYSELSLENQVEKEKELRSNLNALPYTMIIFDEAQDLLFKYNKMYQYKLKNYDNKEVELDLFRLIRRSFRISPFNWEFIWGMFLSTNTTITNFAPTREEDPSLKILKDTFLLPPFLMNCNFDVFAEKFYDSAYQITNPKEYIYNLQRVIDIISCGRPLFYAIFYNGNPSFKEELPGLAKKPWFDNENWSKLVVAFGNLYTLCKSKISGIENPNLVDLIRTSEDVKFAIISAAIGILNIPSSVDKQELVRSRMAWLVAADLHRDGGLEITYASEGFFNSVMAKLLEQYTKCEKLKSDDIILKKLSLSFLEYSNSKSFFNTGEIGEIVCRFLFLLAILRSEIAFPEKFTRPQNDPDFENISSMFYPRRVSDFLNQFVSKEMAEIFLDFCDNFYCKSSNSGEKIFSESLTTFSYFHRCKTVKNPVGFTRTMLYRGCARITPAGHKGADFILPLVSGDNRLGNIMVQVKFVAKSYINSIYCDFDEEGRIKKMRELLEKFKKGEIDPANLDNIIQHFEYTNTIFRDQIPNFNLGKIFGIPKPQNANESAFSSNPQKRFKTDIGNLLDPLCKNLEAGTKNTSNPEGNLGAKKRNQPDSDKECENLSFDQTQDKPFTSLRIFINIREDAQNISTIELDRFGPILLIETNGKFSFLGGFEETMISHIIQKSRSEVLIQELQGQYCGPVHRMSNIPVNPIYYEEFIDNDKSKLKLNYFDGWKNRLEIDYKNRPQFNLKFDKLSGLNLKDTSEAKKPI